ncbi:MAG: ATP-dependent Clp protease ATP-binding subunit [Acidobacteria bacterium]|nr:ATP-dependent Clp protease ATP-binding subunit [Acidobacteriota bacterium]
MRAEHLFIAFQALKSAHPGSFIPEQVLRLPEGAKVLWPSRWIAAAQALLSAEILQEAVLPFHSTVCRHLRRIARDPAQLSVAELFRGMVAGFPDQVTLLPPLQDPRHEAVARQQARRRRAIERLLDADARAERIKVLVSKKVLGQHRVAEALAQAYAATSIRAPGQGPRGIFTFLGEPGTGKTLSAQAFVEALNEVESGGPPWELLRYDMTRYQDYSTAGGLFGIGGCTGRVHEDMAKHPRSVLLFDEIEKANVRVHNAFLPFLNGDSLGHPETAASSAQAWVIVTTNLGLDLLAGEMDLGEGRLVQDPFDVLANAKHRWQTADPEAPPLFSPEFVSRLARGKAVIFRRPAAHHLFDLASRHGAF